MRAVVEEGLILSPVVRLLRIEPKLAVRGHIHEDYGHTESAAWLRDDRRQRGPARRPLPPGARVSTSDLRDLEGQESPIHFLGCNLPSESKPNLASW